jgi:hypothetical protein
MSRTPSLAVFAILAFGLTACGGTPQGGTSATAAGASAAASAVSDAPKPSFELTLGGTVDLPSYASDHAASLDSCSKGSSGGWSYLYAGGDPFVSLDLTLFPGVVSGGTPTDFDLDIGAPSGQVRLVPSGRREGVKGTGTARFEQDGDAVKITIDGSARTMVDGANTGDTTVDLVIHCPA